MRKSKRKQTIFEYLSCKRSDSISLILNSVQARFDQTDLQHIRALYKCMAVVLELRARLNDDENWREFCADQRWEDNRAARYRPKSVGATEWDKTRYLAIAAFAGSNEVRIDRASKYGQVLQHYWQQRLTPGRLPGVLKADGGIDYLLSKLAKERASAALSKSDDRTTSDDDSDVDDNERNNDLVEDEDTAGGDETKNSDDACRGSKDSKSKQKAPRLEIEVMATQLDKALKASPGQRIQIVAIRAEDKGKWKVIRALKIKLL